MDGGAAVVYLSYRNLSFVPCSKRTIDKYSYSCSLSLVREKRFMHVPVIIQLPGYEPISQDNCVPTRRKLERYDFKRVFLQLHRPQRPCGFLHGECGFVYHAKHVCTLKLTLIVFFCHI